MRVIERERVQLDGARWGALFSDDERYRYRLWREVPFFQIDGSVLFCMLNPSTADETQNDPTVERCWHRALMWGYRRMDVVNIFALRSTDPRALFKAHDPVGSNNDLYIGAAASLAKLRVAAWGGHGRHLERGCRVLQLLRSFGPVHHFALTTDGEPVHPLYLPYSKQPMELT